MRLPNSMPICVYKRTVKETGLLIDTERIILNSTRDFQLRSIVILCRGKAEYVETYEMAIVARRLFLNCSVDNASTGEG
jgi:hypothetical protein